MIFHLETAPGSTIPVTISECPIVPLRGDRAGEAATAAAAAEKEEAAGCLQNPTKRVQMGPVPGSVR